MPHLLTYCCRCRRRNYSEWHGFWIIRNLSNLSHSFSCKHSRQLNRDYTATEAEISSLSGKLGLLLKPKENLSYLFLPLNIIPATIWNKPVLGEERIYTALSIKVKAQSTNIIKLFRTFVRGRYVLSEGKTKTKMKNYYCLNFFYGILSFKSFKAPS